MKTRLAILAATAGIAALAQTAAPARDLPVFTEISKQAGITFKQSYGDHHLDNIVEGTGAGACTFDFNNDGRMDLYFVTGTWTKNVSDNEGRDLRGKLSNKLYRNDGNGTFTDVTEQAGAGGKGIFSSGCSAADYDNDGNIDLFVLNYGQNILYHNNGNGTFSDVTEKSGLAVNRWSLCAVWFDYNRDGYLDVFVANYLKYDDGKFRDFYPAAGYPGPLSYNPEDSKLFRNNGDGTFTDVSAETGITKKGGRAMSATVADFNNDGNLDIFVTNDATENCYYEATGKGTFVEKALEMGVAFGENGQGVSSMGPTVGDVNRDGWLDIFIPNLNYCILYQRDVKRGWLDRTRETGLSQALGQYAGWGSVLFDYDHDGWLDLFIAHGNAHHEYVQESTLMRNKGDGNYEDVSRGSGDFFEKKFVSRGVTWGDYFNRGNIDIVVVNINDYPSFLRNEGGRNNWITVDAKLKFPTGTRDANGARVVVTAAGLQPMIEDVVPTRGYMSQGDPRLNFGIGKATTANIEIRWPDGVVQKFENVKANQIFKVVHDATAKPFNGAKP